MRIDPPDLPPHLEEAATLDPAEGLRHALLADADLQQLLAVRVEIDASVLERVVLSRARLSAADVRDSELRACDLANLDLRGARLKTVLLEDCDLRDADLSGARYQAVVLRRCRLDGVRGAASLRGVTMAWDDVLANAGVFATACGVRVADDDDRSRAG